MFFIATTARAQCTGCAQPSFDGPPSVTNGVGHDSLAVADFDQDGRLDVAVPNSSGYEAITIYFGDGAGGFRPQPQVVGPNTFLYPTRIATADLNGDGLPDLVAGGGRLKVWVADGSGGFEVRGPADGLEVFQIAFALGDLNDDGFPDLVWPDPSENAVFLSLGNGDGTFQNPAVFPVSGHPSRIVVGDFNGDSKVDLAVSRQGGEQTVSILLGDGAGGLTPAGSGAFVGNALAITAGDFNDDGHLDVAVGGENDTPTTGGFVSIFFGDGTGQLTAGPTLTDVSPSALIAADLSGDSVPDLVARDVSGKGLTVYVSLGNGSFAPPVSYGHYGAPAAGDFDGDGDMDVALAFYDVFILRNNGSGQLISSSSVPIPGYPSDVVLAKLDGDANLDLLVSTTVSGTGKITSYLGNGDGTFGAAHSVDIAFQPASLSIADFTNDGKADVALVDGFHVVLVPGDGSGGFGSPSTLDAGTFPAVTATADFDGDGKPDLVAVGWNVVVLMNDGLGGFDPGVTLAGNGGYAVHTADLDGVKGPDILVTNGTDLAVYLNDGSGGFTDPSPFPDTGGGEFVVADFDGDGILDVVSNGLDGLAFFRGDGAGGFLPSTVALAGVGSYLLEGADFNGDGHPDIVLASSGASLRIALGDASGSFAEPRGFALPLSLLVAFGVGDLNGDGRPDLVGSDRNAAALVNTNCLPRRLHLATDVDTCALPGAPLGGPPTIGVYDDGGNLVTCDAGNVAAALVPGTGTPGATLGGTTTVAASAGIAAFSDLSIDPAGSEYGIRFAHPVAAPTGTRRVTIGNPPPPPVASNGGPFCQGQDLDLYATTVPGAVYRWTGPNGFTSTLQSPVVAAAPLEAAGTYSVQAIVDGCTSAAAETTVTALTPQIGPEIAGPHQICGGTPLLLRTDSSAFAYQWYLNGSPIPGANVPEYRVDAVSGTDGGNYTLTTSDSTGCTTDPGPAFGVVLVSCAFLPVEIAVDPPGGPGNGNGILEPDEPAVIDPSWLKTPGSAAPLTGTAGAFVGPTGATYTVGDSSADYGTIAPGSAHDCASATGDCYQVTVSAPGGRPATHWDTFLDEVPSSGSPTRTWRLHVGNSFADVLISDPFYPSIERVLHNRITAGCNLTSYCPADGVTRAQMAVLLLKARHGADYVPPPATGAVFSDVPADSFAAAWIEELASEEITAGCGAGLYCPTRIVTRAQMAVFLLRAEHGPGLGVPACTGIFADVPCPGGFAVDWIELLYAEGITGGCNANPLLYCPDNTNARGQMAVFLDKTFHLTLYVP